MRGQVLILVLCCLARAERLPIKIYRTADGLPRNVIHQIQQDRRGFLWISTPDGLAQFDGYRFKTYGPAEGLPDADVSGLLITRDGQYWVGTRKGVCLFRPEAAKSSHPRFTVYQPGPSLPQQHVLSLAEDADGHIWCSTYEGIYRLLRRDGRVIPEPVDLGIPPVGTPRVEGLFMDRSGSIWIGGPHGLYRRRADGRIERYTTAHGLPHNWVSSLIEDRQGRRWAGTAFGLCLLAPNPDPTRRLVERVFTTRDGLAGNHVTALLEDAVGRIWVGTRRGLSRLESSGRFIAYTEADGLSHPEITDLAQDQDGNLWIGGASGGLMKLAHSGFVSYGEADGLHQARIHAIFETHAGELSVVTRAGDGWWLHRFDGRRFAATRPNCPSQVDPGWGQNQHVLEDRRGQWWLPSAAGVWRFPPVGAIEALSTASPVHLGLQAGLPGKEVFRIFEDSRGDVWLATLGGKDVLAKWERATSRIAYYPEARGAATTFREDRAGDLWVGFHWGGLARYRDGRFTFFGEADGLPAGTISDLHVDRTGRLWVASLRGGLARVEQPGARHPRFEVLTTAQGLSSNDIGCVTEDRWGRIYAGTGRGIDRLDPRTGRVRHFTTADGLASGELAVAFADRHGALWFGTLNGLSRLIPEPDPPRSPPPVLVTAVQSGGTDRAVSDLGESRIELPVLAAQQNQLQFGFVGLSLASGEKLLYQSMLEGADRQWSAPDEQRSVRYAGLAPGSYRFRVRAINADGMSSPEPAVVSFRIAPPLWRRWWFQAVAVLLSLAAIYAVHRFRVAHFVRLERVRTRIATDLHDDIGAGLTRVGLLSELALQQLTAREPKAADPMARVAALSRELAESMSDIVWSVNPNRDRLLDLTQRMRRYASDVFTARQIGFQFRAPGPEADRTLEPEIRRQIFLIFKEAVNNIVRHSGCTEASIDFRVENSQLVLRLQDNGRGFDPAESGSGNGLRNMHQRARELRGELEVISAPGQGATITLRAPAARNLLKLTGRPSSVLL